MTSIAATPRARECAWSSRLREFLEQVQSVLGELEPYWPLTLRQVYYQLVASGHIENCRAAYQRLSRVLARARIDGLVPWFAIEDRTRSVLTALTWTNAQKFIDEELGGVLTGYRRDLLQSQKVALELWVEKDALSRVCERVAGGYGVPVVVAKGFASVSYVHDCAERIERNSATGKDTRILYFGDLDPSGWEMLPSMLETLHDELGATEVEGIRCALTPEQVSTFNLPHSIDAIKDGDSRTPKYRAMLREAGHPDTLAVELDALPPAELERLVREAIEENLDLSKLEAERHEEDGEDDRIEELRDKIDEFVKEIRRTA